jgi:hypothetical protein
MARDRCERCRRLSVWRAGPPDVRIDELEEPVAAFRQSSFDLDAAIGALGIADHTLRARAGETGRDVYAFCHTFRRLYDEAHADLVQDLELASERFATRPREGAGLDEWATYGEAWMELTRERDLEKMAARVEGRDPTTALILGFKALYLFVRAHQDSLCALAHLALFPRGTLTGSYNMTAHLDRAGGPVGEFIRSAVPEYKKWYRTWRNARNRVKEGVSFATYGTAEEMGIRFATIIPEGGGLMVNASEGVGLADVVEALEMSLRLHRAIASRAEETRALSSG